jgi:hypothetical protein
LFVRIVLCDVFISKFLKLSHLSEKRVENANQK